MIDRLHIDVDSKKLVKFCRKHHICKLAFFGSVLRKDFRSDSDVDVLVEFEKEHVPGLIRLSGMEIELSGLLGRKADLNTAGFFKPPLRKRILNKAKVQIDTDVIWQTIKEDLPVLVKSPRRAAKSQ